LHWVFGFVTFFFPGAAPSVWRAALPWHALFELFVYVLALAMAWSSGS
jgi:cytochrome b-561